MDTKRIVLHILIWLIAITFIGDQVYQIWAKRAEQPKTPTVAPIQPLQPGSNQPLQPTQPVQPAQPPVDPNAEVLSGMMDNTVMQITNCVGSGEEVVVNGILTNRGTDGDMTFYASYSDRSTLAYDDFGNVFRASKIEVANLSSPYDLTARLISGVPTKISIFFRMPTVGGQLQATKLKVLELRGSVSSGGLICKFRNIPIHRLGAQVSEKKDESNSTGQKQDGKQLNGERPNK